MTYEEAKRKARKVFGVNGHVEKSKVPVLGVYLHNVGTYLNGTFTTLGMGTSWELAFADAEKRATPGPL